MVKNTKHKNKIRDTVKPSSTVSHTKCRTKTCSCLLLVMTVVFLGAGMKMYKDLTEIPDFPALDYNKWWGPNGTTTNQDSSIRPYRILFTDAMQQNLINKFNLNGQKIFTPSYEGAAWNYGINSQALDIVKRHMHFKYDFRKRQRFLNKFDHFRTNIQGLDIHFTHVKPKVEKNTEVLPIVILHGWPSSVREYFELIPLLTAPRHNYDFCFEVIVPSLPGIAYSQASVRSGLSPAYIAILMRNLMQRLGFKKYYIQGGDIGSTVASHMATLYPDEVLGFHSNFLVDFTNAAMTQWVLGSFWPRLVVEEELQNRLYPLKDKLEFYLEERGYMHLQGTKPDTIGIALNDSPYGLASYILDRFMVFTDPSNKNLTDGGLSKYYDLDSLLDNIMIYWSTGCITTSMRLYKEGFLNSDLEKILNRIPTPVPTWALQAKHELVFQPEWMLKFHKYPNLQGSTQLEAGGHFIALEKSHALADDIFKAVNNFREYHRNTKKEL